MNACDYVFGANWTDQYRTAIMEHGSRMVRYESSIARWIRKTSEQSINYAFIWDNTPEGHSVWATRHNTISLWISDAKRTGRWTP